MLIDRKEWARAEMERLLDEGVLEVIELPSKPRKTKAVKVQICSVYIMRVGDAHKIGFARDR